MDLFIYSTASEANQKQLEDSFMAFVPKGKIEVFRSFDNFSQRLKLPAQPQSIAVWLQAVDRSSRKFFPESICCVISGSL